VRGTHKVLDSVQLEVVLTETYAGLIIAATQ
jgi:hypothetical protein